MKSLIYLLIVLSIYTPRNIFSRDHQYSQYVSANAEKLEEALDKISRTELKARFEASLSDIYHSAGLKKQGMNYDVFRKGMIGYYNMRNKNLLNDKEIVTIIDYSMPSTLKRLWIVDIKNKQVLEHTLVAHGKNTGEDLAMQFSNKPGTHMSSLGFYTTYGTYKGKHGTSLIIDGLDKEYNANAKIRSIVIHGASYVCESFISQNGRLGRSHGCPAIPMDKTLEIIELIKDGTCIYIHHEGQEFNSEFLNEHLAIDTYAKYSHPGW
ncbi:MAG: murein L,D-transpeptidase catalytic domain family protein [Cytophagaceae bacterium]